jgi:hypothetical protein
MLQQGTGLLHVQASKVAAATAHGLHGNGVGSEASLLRMDGQRIVWSAALRLSRGGVTHPVSPPPPLSLLCLAYG